MKFFRTLSACAALVMMAACGKTLSVTDTGFDFGNLAELVEISSDNAKLTLEKVDGNTALVLTVKVALIDESPEIRKSAARDFIFSRPESIMTISIADEHTNVYEYLALDSECVPDLIGLLKGSEGLTATLRFVQSNGDESYLKEIYKNSKTCMAEEAYGVSVRGVLFGVVNYTGTIAGTGVHMSLYFNHGALRGLYYYDNMRRKGYTSSMKTFGSVSSDFTMLISEFNDKGKMTGAMKGNASNDKYRGSFYRTKDGREFDIDLSRSYDDDDYFGFNEFEFEVPDYQGSRNYSYDNLSDIDDFSELMDGFVSIYNESLDGTLPSLSKAVDALDDVLDLIDGLGDLF